MNARTPETMPPLPLLWFAILAPPAAWSAHLSVEYFLVTLQCQLETEWAEPLLHVATAALLGLTLAGGLAGWYALRRLERATDGEAVKQRSRFMASAGLVLAGLFLLLIAFGALPVYLLDHCSTGR